MDDHGERLAKIEEGVRYLRESWKDFKGHYEGYIKITHQNSIDLATIKQDKRWVYMLAVACLPAIISLVGYLKK